MSLTTQFTQPEEPGSEHRRTRWLVYAAIIAVAGSQLAAAIGNVQPHLSANDRSRWCTVWSLVERGTFQIDEITAQPGWNTIDKVSHEGHFYSSKPAMLSTAVAGVYWGVKQFTEWNLEDDRKKTVRLILLIVNFIPWMAALIVMAMIVERYARTDSAKIFVLLSAAAGTFLTTFAVTLNNHTVAAVCVTFALYPAMRIVVDGKTNPLCFLLCGFFAAVACTNELPAAVFGLALFGFCFRQHPENTFRFFIPAAMIPLAMFFATNYQATGSWKPFYLEFGKTAYTVFHDGSQSYWANPQGIDRPQDSTGVYLLHCLIGHHGIFSLTPIFLLTLMAWLSVAKWKHFSLKPFLWLGLCLTVIVLGFYLTRTANYNYGGRTSGLRWMFWLIPFWLIAMIPVIDERGRRRGFQVTAAILLAISVFSASYTIENPWQHPWLYQLMEHWGWIDYETLLTR